jgi:16S rRNA (guanine966-N2)-methyltransferase
MRIIAGLAKGMPLVVPRSGVRPTADRIREAIFSSLGARVAGARVLDLFAGTGALGLEAASRGAVAVSFVENARLALESLERNVAEFIRRHRGEDAAPTVFEINRGDGPATLRRLVAANEKFPLILADPPYGKPAQELLRDANLSQLLARDGLLVLESAKREVLAVSKPWELIRQAIYGDTRVSFLRTKPVTQ